jgi:hypothetical protein
MAEENINVSVRVRPLNDREMADGAEHAWVVTDNSIQHTSLTYASFSFGNIRHEINRRDLF